MLNSNVGVGSCPVADGSATLTESISDYPKLTIVEYTNSSPSSKTGSLYRYAGMSFLLESISVDSCHISGFESQITYTYTHKSKQTLEYPIRVYDFVQANKNNAAKKKANSLSFPIGSLISWAVGRAGGGVSAPPFLVDLNKSPSAEDIVTVKQFLDEYIQMAGLVYVFRGDSASTAPVGSGGSVNSSVVSNYTISYNAVPTYKKTVLSWNKQDDYEQNPITKKQYRQLESHEYVLYEGDFKVHLPPGEDGTNSIAPRDLSIMSDNSGITKSCKITKYKWGQPEAEVSATFGYANCALELIDDPEKPNSATEIILAAVSDKVIDSGNAQQEVLSAIQSGKYGYPDDAIWSREPVWRLIQVQETEYIYEPLNITMNPLLKQEDGTLIPVKVPKDYDKFLTSNLEVLTSERTKGWTITRFAQEDPTNWTKGSIASWLTLKTLVDLKEEAEGDTVESKQLYNWRLYTAKVSLEQYLYRRVPIWEEVNYAIAPYSKYYTDLDEVDWQVDYIPKKFLGGLDDRDDTPVPVLYPDPNWAPELMLVAKSRYKSAFGLSGNPDYNPFKRNYWGSNPFTITTGTEEYELTKYSVLPSKNTRPAVTELHADYGHVSTVIGAIGSQAGSAGTVYPVHPYMDINDYGVKGVGLPTINVSSVSAPYPSTNKDREDQYTTLTSVRVAQDQSFKSYTTTQTMSISDGRPPKATLRRPVFEEIKSDEESVYKNSITYITSSVSNGGLDILPSVSVPAAKNIQEALAGARNQLMMSILTSGSNASCQLAWIGTGKSLVNGRVMLPGGNWIIKSSTQTVHSSGGVSFAQPIQIEAGDLKRPSISSNTVQIANENDGQSSVKVLINANLPYQLGTPLENLPSNFSRWLQ